MRTARRRRIWLLARRHFVRSSASSFWHARSLRACAQWRALASCDCRSVWPPPPPPPHRRRRRRRCGCSCPRRCCVVPLLRFLARGGRGGGAVHRPDVSQNLPPRRNRQPVPPLLSTTATTTTTTTTTTATPTGAAIGDLRRLADDLSEADDVEAESGAPLQRHPLLELPPRLLGSEDAAAAARLGHPQRRGRRR